MKTFLRRLRGALGVSVTWGTLFAAVFAALALIVGVLDPDSIDPGETLFRISGIGAVLGFVSGVVFSALLALVERGKKVHELSVVRAAICGTVATAVFPLLTTANNDMAIVLCPIGALVAGGSIAIVKRAELRASIRASSCGTDHISVSPH